MLKATAGLRLLPGRQSQDILDTVEAHLRKTEFFIPPRAVEIMDGSEEGVFAWITVNFLLGRLGKRDKLPTVGIMDLGGGSTQIVLEPSNPRSLASAPGSSVYSLKFGKFTYKLYQHSYLGFGLMEARKKIKSLALDDKDGRVRLFVIPTTAHLSIINQPPNPQPQPQKTTCLPNGFVEDFVIGDAKYRVHGKSHEEKEVACLTEAEAILNKRAPCPHDTFCSFAGVFQPPAHHFPEEMYAFSYFYDRTETMPAPFPESLSVQAYKQEVSKLCNQEYDDPALRGVFESNPHVCMDLCFIHQLLSHGYGLTDSTSLQLAKKIKGYETGWCMGAMMKVLDEHDRFCN